MDTLLYRISASRYAENKEGSGMEARWNREKQFVLYTSSSMALACLEMLANCGADLLIQNSYSIGTWFLPSTVAIREIFAGELAAEQAEWFKRDHFHVSQTIADKWLREKMTAVLKVPSVIIDAENNYLINPQHPDALSIKLLRVQPFRFDHRLKAG